MEQGNLSLPFDYLIVGTGGAFLLPCFADEACKRAEK